MQRVHFVEPQSAEGRTKELYVTVEQVFGVVPNIAKLMGNSPAVLDSFLALSKAMSQASIGDKLYHQIKLATSESNSCSYCNSILTHLGTKAGISAKEMIDGRSASSSEPRTDAALKFANSVLESRGKVGDAELDAVRAAGFGDSEIVEIVASVVAACFTNFLNNVADTTLDIPEAQPLNSCSC